GSDTPKVVTRPRPTLIHALARYSRNRLTELARQADSGLTEEDFTDAMQRLDRMDDAVFREIYGLTATQVNEIRHCFSTWPRFAP
ncbi:hypothetical protein ACFHWS_19090, partial [Micromonospora sp. LOL_013]